MCGKESLRDRSSGSRRALLLGAIIFSAFAAGCSETDRGVNPVRQDTLTVAFQDLVSPSTSYAGTSDAILKDGPATQFRNGNFGAVPYDTIGGVRLGSSFYERRLILRMDISSIKNCSKVIRATLAIRVVPPAPDSLTLGACIVLPAARDAWVEGIGGLGAGVSWTTVDGGVPWTYEGGDFDPAPLDVRTVRSADSACVFTLPPQAVLGWIRNPESNHGMIVRSLERRLAARTTVFTREHESAGLHPRLEIVYLTGG